MMKNSKGYINSTQKSNLFAKGYQNSTKRVSFLGWLNENQKGYLN
jgi:hypothetical protein